MNSDIKNHIQSGGGVIIAGPASIAANMTTLMQDASRAQQLHLVNVVSPSATDTLEVLHGTPNDIANTLASLLPEERNPGALFYRNTTIHAIEVISEALQATKAPVRLSTLMELLSSEKALNHWLEEVNAQLPESHHARVKLNNYLNMFRRGMADGAPISVGLLRQAMGGMAGRIALLTQGAAGQVFDAETPEHNLEDILARREVLYVQLPEDMGPDAQKIICLVMESVKRTLGHTQTSVPPVEFDGDQLHGVLF